MKNFVSRLPIWCQKWVAGVPHGNSLVVRTMLHRDVQVSQWGLFIVNISKLFPLFGNRKPQRLGPDSDPTTISIKYIHKKKIKKKTCQGQRKYWKYGQARGKSV